MKLGLRKAAARAAGLAAVAGAVTVALSATAKPMLALNPAEVKSCLKP